MLFHQNFLATNNVDALVEGVHTLTSHIVDRCILHERAVISYVVDTQSFIVAFVCQKHLHVVSFSYSYSKVIILIS